MRAPLVISWALLVVTLLAAVREAFIALGWLSLGTVSGQRGPLAFVGTLAILGLFAGGGLLMLTAAAAPRISARLAGSLPIALLAPAAGLLVIAQLYSYDDYYLPTLRRYSDNYRSTGAFVAIVVIGSLVSALAGRFTGHVGVFVVGLALWLAVVAMLAQGMGH